MKKRWAVAVVAVLALLPFGSIGIAAAASEPSRAGTTPPRLSYLAGDVSAWRPGDENWSAARLNLALAPGDALYSGRNGRLEVQFGAHAFLRADAGTQLALDNQEPDYIVFRVGGGRVSLDIRSLDPGDTVEIDSPHGSLSLDQPGYYRLDVSEEGSRFITRRGGRARLTPASGDAVDVVPNQEVVVDAHHRDAVGGYAAPALDDWDRWSYARSDELLAATSLQYVGDDEYGAADLDHYGKWRDADEYGQVWVPDVDPAWVPYSTGSWDWDSYYGWTWVDAAPWGWAPFHYGRWVYLHNCWGWAPGPIVAPVYAPALVTFFGGSGFQVGIGFGAPAISWVALGWGEPCLPWWGGTGFVGHPWWGGWGGPHIVDHHIVHNTNINITNVNVFEHVHDRRGVVAVPRDRFGDGRVEKVRLARVENVQLSPAHELLPTRPATGAGVAPAHERSGAPDQVRGPRVTSIDPRAAAATAPTRRQLREPASAQPPSNQERGKTHDFAPPPARLEPHSESHNPSGVYEPRSAAPQYRHASEPTRLTPPAPPAGGNRASQHVERVAPSSAEPLRFDQESLQRRPDGATRPDHFSVIQRAAPPQDNRVERETVHRENVPQREMPHGSPAYSVPERFSNREPMPRLPSAPAPVVRAAPVPQPAPRLAVPQVAPRMESHAPMPQHVERGAPAAVPQVAIPSGGSSSSGGAAPSRSGPHGH